MNKNLYQILSKCSFVMILGSIIVLFFSVQSDANGTWYTQFIDTLGNIGKYSSIDVDSSDNVHIAYIDSDNSCLKYATNSSGSWVVETPPKVRTVRYSGYTSIALDSSDAVHISHWGGDPFYPGCMGYLFYTRKNLGSWIGSEILEPVGYYTSLAIDTSDKVHISFTWASCYPDHLSTTCSCGYELGYTTNTSGSWQLSSNFDNPLNLSWPSIAIDANDKIHISYGELVYEGNNIWAYNLKYASNSSGVWQYTRVDTTGSVGKYSSIAIDSNDKVHISYYDATNENLKYATNLSGSWKLKTLDINGSVGKYNSIDLDSSNNIHICYYDETNGNLKYTTNASNYWTIETVDGFGDVGSYASLKMDSSDNINISYYDATGKALKYAMKYKQTFNPTKAMPWLHLLLLSD